MSRFRRGTVVTWSPGTTGSGRCQGWAVATGDGVLFDTYFRDGWLNHRLTPEDVETCRVVAHLDEYVSHNGWSHTSVEPQGWADYAPADRLRIPHAGGLTGSYYTRSGAGVDVDTMVANAANAMHRAKDAAEAALSELRAAEDHFLSLMVQRALVQRGESDG